MNKRIKKKKEMLSKRRASSEYANRKMSGLSIYDRKVWVKYMTYNA